MSSSKLKKKNRRTISFELQYAKPILKRKTKLKDHLKKNKANPNKPHKSIRTEES